MTTAEYLQTPETVLPRELARGVLRVANAPTPSHQRVVGRLFLALEAFVRVRGLGEVLLAPLDVILDYDAAIVVQPDVIFVSRERSGRVTDRVWGAPDVAIDVLSPHPRIGRLDERVGWFAAAGVRECWLASVPERRVALLKLGSGGVRERHLAAPGECLQSEVLAEFVVPRDLFHPFV